MDEFDPKNPGDMDASPQEPAEDAGDYSSYSEVDQTSADDLMDTIGIDLEKTKDLTAQAEEAIMMDPGPDGGIDFEKVGINISRAVLHKVEDRIHSLLVSAIEEAVEAEMEKLKAFLYQ